MLGGMREQLGKGKQHRLLYTGVLGLLLTTLPTREKKGPSLCTISEQTGGRLPAEAMG